MVKYTKQKNLDIVFCTAKIMRDGVHEETRFKFYPNHTIKDASEVERLVLEDRIGGQPWMKICKRSCWEKVRFAEGIKYEDLAMSWLPFAHSNGKVGFLTEPFYNYRMNQNGTSLSHDWNRAGDIFFGFYQHYLYAIEHRKESKNVCLSKALSFALGTYNSYIRSGKKTDKNRLNLAVNFIDENKKYIWKLQELSLSRKLLITAYCYFNPLYNCMLVLFNNI